MLVMDWTFWEAAHTSRGQEQDGCKMLQIPCETRTSMHEENPPERILGSREMNPGSRIPKQTQISAGHRLFQVFPDGWSSPAVCSVFLRLIPFQWGRISVPAPVSGLSKPPCVEAGPQVWTTSRG